MQTKEMPNSPKAEQAVIGAILIESDAYYRIADVQTLSENDFYNDKRRFIFEHCKKALSKYGKIDSLLVAESMKTEIGVGDKLFDYIIHAQECTNVVASSANLEEHVLVLKEFAMRRQLIVSSCHTITGAYDNSVDVFDLAEKSQKRVAEVTDQLTVPPASIEQIFDELDSVAYGVKTPVNIVVETGIDELDKITQGVESDDIIILAGVSGSGKTAKACNLVEKFLDKGLPLAFFSYEMTAKKLLMRIICNAALVSYDSLKNGKMSEDELMRYEHTKSKIIKSGLLHIYDCTDVSIQGIVSRAMALKMKLGKLGGIIIDYLQLIPTDVRHRDENVATKEVMKGLMRLMKRCECPVIGLSQIVKSVGKEMPQVFHLHGAQVIEATGTKIFIIHRPEKFGVSVFEDGTSAIGKAQISIAKNREGQAGDVIKVDYQGAFYRFENEQDSPF